MEKTFGEKASQIAADMNRVASELSVDPVQLTSTKYHLHGVFSERQVRKHGGFAFIRNAFFGKTERAEGEVYAIKQINKEVARLRDIAGEKEYLYERLVPLLEKLPPIKVTYHPKSDKAKLERTVNLVLSDLHIGSDLTRGENLKDYGSEQEAQALWAIVKNVCEYKAEHRKNTDLVVNILGDVIENHLHGPGDAALLHIQVCRAIYLLNQAIALLSASFPHVQVNFAVGNHGRDISIHPKRATSQKFNSLETTVYYAVKSACRRLENVDFNQPITPWVDYLSQGHRVFATHGDTVLNPGNPGQNIQVRSLENQINKLNATLKDREEYRIAVMGHVHQAMVTQLPNGCYVITNGALTPPNGFAQSIGILEAPQVQVLWESTRDYPVGDFRFISVGKPDKKSKILPFTGLESF